MFDEGKVAYKNTDMIQGRLLSNDKLKSIVAKQPVTAGMVVTEAFKSYQKGILTEEFLRCSDEKK